MSPARECHLATSRFQSSLGCLGCGWLYKCRAKRHQPTLRRARSDVSPHIDIQPAIVLLLLYIAYTPYLSPAIASVVSSCGALDATVYSLHAWPPAAKHCSCVRSICNRVAEASASRGSTRSRCLSSSGADAGGVDVIVHFQTSWSGFGGG